MPASESPSSLTHCVLWAALALGAAGGCRHAPPPPVEGKMSFQVLRPSAPAERPGDARLAAVAPREVYVEAEPLPPLIDPVYPAEALRARVAWTSVSVSLTIDARGRVVRVAPSTLGFTTPGRFTADFYSAVETAVMQWQFSPAELWQVEHVEREGRTYPMVTRTEKVETTLDLAFAFTPSGAVLTPAGGKK